MAFIQPEIINTYKVDGQEVIVLTGNNPKCPPGYKVVKTNINECESDTKVIVCVKGDKLPSNCIKKSNCDGLDYNDVLALAVTDAEYEDQHFAFGERSDAFDNKEEDFNLSAELWMIVLLLIVAMIYLINNKSIKKIDIDIQSPAVK